MIDDSWFEETKKLIGKITELVKECDEPYREKCFEILLMEAIKQTWNPSSARDREKLKVRETPSVIIPGPSSQRFEIFLSENGLTVEEIGRVIDINSGAILTRNLGSSISDIQRKTAILIAVYHLFKDGELIIPKKELKEWCEKLGAYNVDNFARYMKTAEHDNIVIFVDDKVGWKISAPGEKYLTKVIKELSKPKVEQS